MSLVDKIVSSAQSYVGTQEGSAAHQDIIAYQTKNKLEVDGIVGKETWGYLLLKEK